MPSLFRALTGRAEPARSEALPLSLDEWVQSFSFGGLGYSFAPTQTLGGDREEIEASFAGYVEAAYKRNGVVFACMLVRLLLFSEARFQFRRLSNGRPGNLFGTSDLQLLETPWPNATTGDLLTRTIQDADLGGNSYWTRRAPTRPGGRPSLKRLRPDWVTIVAGSQSDSELDAELIGYLYHPGGRGSGTDPVALLPENVAHFAPIPDPEASYRGMSWLTPIVREVLADGAATTHKQQFFENGATPNMVVKLGPEVSSPEVFEKWVDVIEDRHAGVANAYRTLYLAAGQESTVVGSHPEQIDFKVTQGAGETRIAAAAGVPPVIVGLSEGLQSATYSNYGQARRRLADGTMRPLWRNVAGSLATLVTVPAGAELWYDDRDIPFLQEDRKDAAAIQQTQAQTIRTLVDAGYEPDSVIAAVAAEDWDKLSHSGMFSVQLHPAGTEKGDVLVGTPQPINGNGGTAPADAGANSARVITISVRAADLPRFIADPPAGWVVTAVEPPAAELATT
jgi:phage portal protein BeeE